MKSKDFNYKKFEDDFILLCVRWWSIQIIL